MRESVNTFTKGLVMDLNPATTPNDVLTNCLNGTILTYNGNEYTLQSDFGNGRVESAYLPSGYVPLGVKESGGIIYVASYNPITNKSLIGSFPSPERNISSEELGDSDAEINFSSFSDNLVLRIKLFGKEAIIRAGDKFSIIMIPNTLYDLSKIISNYLNTKNGEIIGLKNKLLTLDVAVLDNNNNLHTITSSLKRFNLNTNEEVEDLYSLPSDIKYNTEYFTLTFDLSLDLQSPDAVDLFRKRLARNVFNSKLVGNLCLVATLNTVQYFGLSVGGTKLNNNSILYFDSIFEYNCPDGRYPTDTALLKIYGNGTNYDPSSSIIGYNLEISKLKEKVLIPFRTTNINFNSSEYNEEASCIQYNEDTNLFTSKQLDTYTLEGITEGVVYYKATPVSIVGELPGLAISGLINLDKIGSGELSLTHWRYYKNLDYLSLQWGLESYPKYGEEIEDVRFLLYDVYLNDYLNPTYITYLIDKKRNYNGVFNEILHLPTSIGVNNRLFLVKIEYKTNKDSVFKVLDYRWLFNTPLYNTAYAKGEVLDFGANESILSEYRKLEIAKECDLQLTRSEKLSTSPRKIEDTESRNTYELETYTVFLYNPRTTMELTHSEDLPFEGRITFSYTSSADTEGILNSFLSENISTLGTMLTNLINTSNFKQNSNIETLSNNQIKVSAKARLEYYPKEKEVIAENIFSPILESKGRCIGDTSNPVCLMSGVRELKDNSNDSSRGYINLAVQNRPQLELLAVFKDSKSINYVSGDGYKNWIVGLGNKDSLNYDLILETIKNSYSSPIIILSSNLFQLSDTWKPEDSASKDPRTSVNTCISESMSENAGVTAYLSAWWKNTDDTPILLDWFVYADSGESAEDIKNRMWDTLYNIFGNYFKYNATYSGLNIKTVIPKGLVDLYGYNNDYRISYNFLVNILYSNINVETDNYYSGISDLLDNVYTQSPSSRYLLETLSTFTYSDTTKETFTSAQVLDVTGLLSLYNVLSSNTILYAFGRHNTENQFEVLATPESANTGYAYSYKDGSITEAPSWINEFFVEKLGVFCLRNSARSIATNNRYIISRVDNEDTVICKLAFNNIPIAGLSSLVSDPKFKKW